MKCPFCNHLDTKVINSRAQDENTSIRRRRQCEKCSSRFTTFERVDTIPMAVIKRDGSREAFDRNKLLGGMVKSCNKRPVTMQQMESIVTDIENKIMNSLEREVESSLLGEMVMNRLKEIDGVAYVRFASVYRQFEDISSFRDELNKILKENKEKNEN